MSEYIGIYNGGPATKIATTVFTAAPSNNKELMIDLTPKIIAKPISIDSSGQWFAPAGIRRGSATPTFWVGDLIPTEAELEQIDLLRWNLLTLSFDDLISIQNAGAKYRFEKVSLDGYEQIHLVFESETDEAMSMFIIRPKKNGS